MFARRAAGNSVGPCPRSTSLKCFALPTHTFFRALKAIETDEATTRMTHRHTNTHTGQLRIVTSEKPKIYARSDNQKKGFAKALTGGNAKTHTHTGQHKKRN